MAGIHLVQVVFCLFKLFFSNKENRQNQEKKTGIRILFIIDKTQLCQVGFIKSFNYNILGLSKENYRYHEVVIIFYLSNELIVAIRAKVWHSAE